MNVLAVFAHPDDEALGAGGALAKHADAGDSTYVYVYCATRAISGYQAACDALSAYASHGLYDDQVLDTVKMSELVACLEAPCRDWDPDLIYTHHPGDLNPDHALTARAVLTAFRAPDSQATILACEVLSSTEFGPAAFEPNHWEVLSKEQVDVKCRALDCYPTEVRDRPHPRNAEGIMVQARYRGQQICQPYAEAFRVLRSIR